MRSVVAALLVSAGVIAVPRAAWAHGEGHPIELDSRFVHFSHPLFVESPSPDTKVRLDYLYGRLSQPTGHRSLHTVAFEGEVALHPAFSLAVALPGTFVRGAGPDGQHTGDLELSLKAASYAFGRRGLLLGSGLSVGLPTGDDTLGIGSDHLVELEPFLDVGYRWRGLEVIAFVTFGIPFNQDPGEEVETDLGYQLAVVYAVLPQLPVLAEMLGETSLSGPEAGATEVRLAPGIEVKPLGNDRIMLGASVGLPASRGQDLGVEVLGSFFYHFGWLGPRYGAHSEPPPAGS